MANCMNWNSKQIFKLPLILRVKAVGPDMSSSHILLECLLTFSLGFLCLCGRLVYSFLIILKKLKYIVVLTH